MSALFNLVKTLHNCNALHVRRNKHLQSWSVAENSNHLIEEVVEIQAEVFKIPDMSNLPIVAVNGRTRKKLVEEIGDALAVMYNLMYRCDITESEVNHVAVAKLNETFSIK